jgi:hypothetical protein
MMYHLIRISLLIKSPHLKLLTLLLLPHASPYAIATILNLTLSLLVITLLAFLGMNLCIKC